MNKRMGASLRTPSAFQERMLKRVAKPLTVALIVLIGFPGCSMFDKNRRRELAYQRYVMKNIRRRQRQILRSQKAALRRAKKYIEMTPTEPKITAGVEPVPEPAQAALGASDSQSPAGEADNSQTQP